jgi:sec-independent protein translocase protein TatA
MNEWFWVVILGFIVLLLFGAKRIPEVMKSVGQGVKEFKKAAKEITSEDTAASSELPSPPSKDNSQKPA